MSTVKPSAEGETHVTLGSVFDDLGFSPKKAASLKLKSALHQEIVKQAEKYSRGELEKLFSETQSRVSQLMTGKISGFTLDMLVFYADRLGIRTELKTKPVPTPADRIWASKGPVERSTSKSAAANRYSPIDESLR